MTIRLDVGSGQYRRKDESWTTVDKFVQADLQAEMGNLPLKDDSVAEIWSGHALEHLPRADVIPTLQEWFRVLETGATCTILVPDLDDMARKWLYYGMPALVNVFGSQVHEGEFHKTGWNLKGLCEDLEFVGFSIREAESVWTSDYNQQSLHVVAMKKEIPVPTDKKVAVGFCYRTMSPSEFSVRMIRLWTESPEVQQGGLIYVPYRHWLYEARNEMVRDFLGTQADALLMIDTDMTFTTDDVRRLITLDSPIAASAYMFDLGRLDAALETPDGIQMLQSSPLPDKPGQVDYAGTGFMLIQREVFEKIGQDWFNHTTLEDGTWLWEDWSFCKRAREAGFPIWLDPKVRPGHLKNLVLTPEQPMESAGDL